MRHLRKRLVRAVAAIVIGCGTVLANNSDAEAASINIVNSTGLFEVTPSGVLGLGDLQTTNVDTVADDQDSASVQSHQSNPGELFAGEILSGEATATASGDIVTGELKASVFTAMQGDLAQNQIGGAATVEMSETFAVSGSGNVTFLLGFDGSVDVMTQDFPGGFDGAPAANFQAIASLELLRFTTSRLDIDGFSSNPGTACTSFPCQSLSDSFSGELSVSTFVHAGTGPTITVTAFLLAQMVTGAGHVDMSQTGQLFMIIDPNSTLTLDPLDQNFLENPSFGSTVVPLPAAFPLFGTGLGILGFLGWRRRRRLEAV